MEWGHARWHASSWWQLWQLWQQYLSRHQWMAATGTCGRWTLYRQLCQHPTSRYVTTGNTTGIQLVSSASSGPTTEFISQHYHWYAIMYILMGTFWYIIYIYMSIYLYTNFSSKSWKCIPQEGHYTKQKGLGACSSNTYRPWKWIHMYVCWINVSYCIW